MRAHRGVARRNPALRLPVWLASDDRGAVPKQESTLFASAPRLDFTVTLPAGIAVDVADTSGELTIRDTGNARVATTSSNMKIRNVHGNLTVRDTSGDIDIEDVSGDFTLQSKTSGRVDYKRVSGRVTVPRRYRR